MPIKKKISMSTIRSSHGIKPLLKNQHHTLFHENTRSAARGEGKFLVTESTALQLLMKPVTGATPVHGC